MEIKNIIILVAFFLFLNCKNKSEFSVNLIKSLPEEVLINENDFRFDRESCCLKYFYDESRFYTTIYINTCLKSRKLKGEYLLKNDSLLLGAYFVDDENNNNLFNEYKLEYNFKIHGNFSNVCFLYDSLDVKYPNEDIKKIE